MVSRMLRLEQLWARLLRLSQSLCAVLILLIGAIVSYEVIARSVFNAPTIWSQEIAVYLLIACAFFGYAPTMQAGEHIRIDLLIKRFRETTRQVVELLTCICIAVFAGIAAWGGFEMMAQSFRYGRKSLTLLAVPVWIPQLLVPVGMVLLLIVVLVRGWQLALQLRGPRS